MSPFSANSCSPDPFEVPKHGTVTFTSATLLTPAECPSWRGATARVQSLQLSVGLRGCEAGRGQRRPRRGCAAGKLSPRSRCLCGLISQHTARAPGPAPSSPRTPPSLHPAPRICEACCRAAPRPLVSPGAPSVAPPFPSSSPANPIWLLITLSQPGSGPSASTLLLPVELVFPSKLEHLLLCPRSSRQIAVARR